MRSGPCRSGPRAGDAPDPGREVSAVLRRRRMSRWGPKPNPPSRLRHRQLLAQHGGVVPGPRAHGQGWAVCRRRGFGRGKPCVPTRPAIAVGRPLGASCCCSRWRQHYCFPVVTAATMDIGARPAGLYRLGPGADPGGRRYLGGRHRHPDPAGLDRPVPPAVGVCLHRGRDRGRRGDHLAGARGGPGCGDRPPGAAMGLTRRADLRRRAWSKQSIPTSSPG